MIGRCAIADDAAIDLAAEAAAAAAPGWAAVPLERHMRLGTLFREELLRRKDEFVEMLVAESHPVKLARWELSCLLQVYSEASIRWYVQQMHTEFEDGGRRLVVRRQPDGVVAFNPPQNAPAPSAALAVLAVMAGNAVVVRAPRSIALSTLWVLRDVAAPLLDEVGTAPGTLNVVCANPKQTLDRWITSPGVLDSGAAAKLSGARFSVSRGPGALLERALASLLLDLHTREHGYTEYSVPHLVSRETMTGTGQLPKFEEDLFATTVGGREMFLIPTAEVPLTNLVARAVLDERELPLAMTARTPCYRGEAGSYGRDTRGILRLHQFEKVELVRVCRDEDAGEQLELMIGHVEECLKRLELSYQVVLLPAGDIGFSARTTYDVEVWLPGSDTYREISSVSDCGTFQGRRAGGSRKIAATLNGSGLPIGRTVAALLEQGQQTDGSVLLPEALASYTGFRRLLPGGGTE
ncbi:serine--tRNA ligase [Streptomyces sp. NPDC055722]